MRLKLFLLALLAAVLPMVAQTSNVVGVVVNGSTGAPVSGASVTLQQSGATATTNFSGDFSVTARGTTDLLIVTCDGYEAYSQEVTLASKAVNLGTIRLTPNDYTEDYYGDATDMVYDEAVMEDEEGNAQGIAALTGANDNL